MEENKEFETTNISTLWNKNIFENVKNLEEMERLAREGCQSILQFIQMDPNTIHLILPEIQYKNLKMMVSEIGLLLSDLSPVVDETFYKEIELELAKYKIQILTKKFFIVDIKEQLKVTKKPKILNKYLTNEFYNLLEKVSDLKVKIIKKIAPILFVEKKEKDGEEKL